MKNKHYSRRDFMRIASKMYMGTLVSLTGVAFLTACDYSSEGASMESGFPAVQGKAELDLEVNLRAMPAEQAVFPGQKTHVWKYMGEVVQGNPDSLLTIPNSYLGPIFRVKKGPARAGQLDQRCRRRDDYSLARAAPLRRNGWAPEVCGPAGQNISV
jgi:hypothetical protein